MSKDEPQFLVGPTNGDGKNRLVITIYRGGEVHRDLMDTNKAAARFKYLKEVAIRIGEKPENFVREYDQAITQLADTADAEADQAAAKQPAEEHRSQQGQTLKLEWPEPWPEPVALSVVLDEVAAWLRRYVVLPDTAADAIALWCCWTYVVERSTVAPLLVLTSPTKRCGKTTLLRLIGAVCPRVLPASHISPAALFRVIEEQRPTLLIDEADTFAKDNEELRGVLNAGHTRDLAYVVRCVGDDHEPRTFSTWGAKVLACIGRLPGTVEDRAIVIGLERRKRGESVERVTPRALAAGRELGRKLMRWAVDFGNLFESGESEAVPALLDDRAADNWRPLMKLAELAGGEWTRRAANAAVYLSANRDTADEELSTLLLRDVRTVFESDGRDEIPSTELAAALAALSDSPWATISRGRPITTTKLGRLLSGFGIRPTHTRAANVYAKDAFLEAWQRYLPSPPDSTFQPFTNDASADAIRI